MSSNKSKDNLKDNLQDGSKRGFANAPKKWQDEADKIRKVQISLDFPDTADILLRVLAARKHKAPSSMIREILGMPSNPPKRARIGVSFNDDELIELGRRYGVEPDNKAEIRRKMTEEVTQVLSNTQGLDSEESRSERENEKTVSNFAIQELQSASDSIHDRFKQALDARKK